MPAENLIPLFIFAGALVCTPGPANMVLMAAGARAGLRACLPLVAGVTLGKIFVHAGLALGLWQIIDARPGALLALKIAGAAYILYLAFKIVRLKIDDGGAKRMSGFVAGLIVHPTNPKAWAMIVSAYGQFIDAESAWWPQTIAVAAVFFFWQCIAHTLWCWSGQGAARLVAGTRYERHLMIVLAAVMLAAVGWSLAR